MKFIKFIRIPNVIVHQTVSICKSMPRKSKGKLKTNRNNRLFPNYEFTEVFRNSSAVADDTDPVEALKCMKEIFKNKIEDDVITMIFSECSYDVNQTFETLSSLCNYGEIDCHPKDKQCNKKSLTENSALKDADAAHEFNISETAAVHNVPKYQNKSKLAINFPSSFRSSSNSPRHANLSHEVVDHSFAHTSNKNSHLAFSCILNTSSFENSAAGSSSSQSECHKSSNNNFLPTYFPGQDNTTNVSSPVACTKQRFEGTGHQFISPILPLPMYRLPSPQKSEGCTFRNTSRNFHFSQPEANKLGNNQKKTSEIAKATEKIQLGSKVLVILRGLPGSGKSSLAAKLKFSGEVFSTDDFFIENGEYIFDPYKLNEAHVWNKQRTKQALERGVSPIIIDNTNVEAWEMAPYILLGKKYDYEIIILEPDTPWKFNVRVLASKNKHKVSKSKIQKMKEKYQHNITVEKILKSCNFLNSKSSEEFSVDDTLNELCKINDKKLKKFKTDNHICLADIHQEEISDFNEQSDRATFKNYSTLEQVNTNFHVSFDNESVNSSDGYEVKNNDMQSDTDYNEVTTQSIIINDLDDLKALVREDTEESLSHQSSATGSFQDVSCWEAITEHDEDFLWTDSKQDKYSRNVEKMNGGNLVDIQSSDDESYHSDVCNSDRTATKIFPSNMYSKSKSLFQESVTSHKWNDTSDEVIKSNSSLNSPACVERNDDILTFEACENSKNNDSKFLLTLNKNSDEKLWLEKNPSESESKCSQFVDQKYAVVNKENKLSQSFECLRINEKINPVSSSMPQLTDNNNLFQEKYFMVRNKNTAFHVSEHEHYPLECSSSNEENKLDNLFGFSDKEIKISNTEDITVSDTKPKPQQILGNHSVNMCEMHFESAIVPSTCESFDLDSHNYHSSIVFSDNENECKLQEEISCNTDHMNMPQPKPQRLNSNHISKFNEDSFEKIIVPDSGISFIDEDNDLEWNISNEEIKSSIEEKLAEVPVVPKPQRAEFKSKSSSKKNDSVNGHSKKSFLNISVDAIDSDWKMPDYYAFDDAPKTERPIKVTSLVMMSVCSQTEPQDFIFIHNVSNDDNCVNSSYKVLSAGLTNLSCPLISDSKSFITNAEADVYSNVITFDKSTSTDDMVECTEVRQKISELHECFPDISFEDLHHLLEMCHNDETWLSNLLLEWGYKYNVHKENVCNIEEKVDIKDVNIYNLSDTKNNQEQVQSVVDDKNQNLCEVDFSQTLNQIEVPEDSTKLLSVKNTNNCQKLRLILNSSFAHQLEELFGPVTNTCTKADRCVEIDLEFAQLLHAKWKNTITQSKKTSEDGKDMKKINVTYCEKEGRKVSEELISTKKDPNEPVSLAEIMDMEFALQLHKEEKLQKDTDFAIKLKRQELYNMYPGADTIALDEIFESNNFSLTDSIFALGEDIGQHQTIPQKRHVEKMDECLVEWKKRDIFQEFETGDYSDWIYKEEDIGSIAESTIPVASSILAPGAAELRELAVKHYKLRQEFISKAQAAYCRGAKDVASFYAQRGSEHGELFKDANKRASTLIAQQRNLSTSSNVLDLHGLYVQEAIPILEKFLRDKKLDVRRKQINSPLTISVITGKGVHSCRGPKLRPSVYEYLKKAGYSFFEVNPGMLDVTITPE